MHKVRCLTEFQFGLRGADQFRKAVFNKQDFFVPFYICQFTTALREIQKQHLNERVLFCFFPVNGFLDYISYDFM